MQEPLAISTTVSLWLAPLASATAMQEPLAISTVSLWVDPLRARGRAKLTDILGLVAMQGQADIVARVGLGLNRSTWSDPDMWRACIDVVFGETKIKANNYEFESTARTRLMIYINRGRCDHVKLILSNPPKGYRADPNANATVKMDGETIATVSTPLKCAIEQKLFLVASLLLQLGADPNQAVSNDPTNLYLKHTPLELASDKDSLPIVRLLVDGYGVKVPGAFPLGEVVPHHHEILKCKPLTSAIRKNNLSMARYFVETKGVRMNYPNPELFDWDEEEKTWVSSFSGEPVQIGNGDLKSYLEDALSMDAASISLEMVTLLLDAGAVVNFIGSDSESPLYKAVDKGRMDVVTLLLARGADPNLASDRNLDAPIIASAKNNALQMAILLLAAGANVLATINHQDQDNFDDFDIMAEGLTALHHFAEHSNAEGVALMLQEGAEIDAVTSSGFSPLLLLAKGVGKMTSAASAERIAAACACCRCLINAGADVNFVRVLTADFIDMQGGFYNLQERQFTALTYATEFNCLALVDCLVAGGANVEHCTEFSFSLLMRAASKGAFDVLALIENGTVSQNFINLKYQNDVFDEDEWNSFNALHFCLGEDNQENCARCAKILIDAGISLDRNGNDLNAAMGNTEIFKMLLPTMHKDVNPMILLENAVNSDKFEIATLLLHQFSTLDVNDTFFFRQSAFTVAGVPYSGRISAFCYLAVTGKQQMLDVFCSKLTTVQIDQVYKCETREKCESDNGTVYFERKYAYYNALTLALQHSAACARLLIRRGASPLPPSPFPLPQGQMDLPDLTLANSPLMQAIENGGGRRNQELVSLMAASLQRSGLATNMLLQAIECTLRRKLFVMAKVLIENTDMRQLGLTERSQLQSIKMSIETKNYRRDKVNFLGWQFQLFDPFRRPPGQTIRFVETVSWHAPPPSVLDVALKLFAAETSLADCTQYRTLAVMMLSRCGPLTDNYLDLLIYSSQLGPRASLVFDLVSQHMIFHDWHDSRYAWAEDISAGTDEVVPFTWARAVINDWPGAGHKNCFNEECRFVGLQAP